MTSTERRCSISSCSTRLAVTDSHPICITHRTCTRQVPCSVCRSWTSVEWENFFSRQRKASNKWTLRSLRRESLSSSGGESGSARTDPVSSLGREGRPTSLPVTQGLAIEPQVANSGVVTFTGEAPVLPARKTKSRKKSLSKTLRLARRQRLSAGVLQLPPPTDSAESWGVDGVHRQHASLAGVPNPPGGEGTSSVDLGITELGVLSASPTAWSGLLGPLHVPTERLAEASSEPKGSDDATPVVYSCPQGQESDRLRPPGAREPVGAAVPSVIPISAVSPEMAGTQDPGPGTQESLGAAVPDDFPGTQDSAGPPRT